MITKIYGFTQNSNSTHIEYGQMIPLQTQKFYYQTCPNSKEHVLFKFNPFSSLPALSLTWASLASQTNWKASPQTHKFLRSVGAQKTSVLRRCTFPSPVAFPTAPLFLRNEGKPPPLAFHHTTHNLPKYTGQSRPSLLAHLIQRSRFARSDPSAGTVHIPLDASLRGSRLTHELQEKRTPGRGDRKRWGH